LIRLKFLITQSDGNDSGTGKLPRCFCEELSAESPQLQETLARFLTVAACSARRT
jgi:hypothetical protein